jgi:hypothetical protein
MIRKIANYKQTNIHFFFIFLATNPDGIDWIKIFCIGVIVGSITLLVGPVSRLLYYGYDDVKEIAPEDSPAPETVVEKTEAFKEPAARNS